MNDYMPIADHGLIGDLYTVALVGTDGMIDWYCCPRFDSPSVFGSILDAQRGGTIGGERRLPGGDPHPDDGPARARQAEGADGAAGDQAVRRDQRGGGAVVWLCSDRSSFVTGIAMPVDAGATAF